MIARLLTCLLVAAVYVGIFFYAYQLGHRRGYAVCVSEQDNNSPKHR